MWNIIEKLDEHLEEWLLVPSLAISVIIVFGQVVMRYVFSNSLSWSEEVARHLFVWQVWLGASYAIRKQRHIRVIFIKKLLSDRMNLALEYFVLSVWFIFCVVLVVISIPFTEMIFERNQLSSALQIPMGYAYLSVPVGFALMLFRLTQIIYQMLFKNRQEI